MHALIPGALIFAGDLLLRFLSIIVPYLLIEFKTGKKITRMVKAVLFVVGILAYLCMHLVLLGHLGIIATVKRIVFGDYTYQDIIYLPLSLVAVTIIVSVILSVYINLKNGRQTGGKTSFAPERKKLLYTLASILLLAVVSLAYLSFSGDYKIIISEVQPNSEAIFKREVFGNYIEVYNTGDLECELKGMYLSDDLSNLKKLPIEDTKMQPGSYMVQDVDGDVFSIKKSGGQTFYLSDVHGNILSSVTTPKINEGMSYSLLADGTWAELKPTPRYPSTDGGLDDNSMVYTKDVKSPVLSHEAGFYDEPFYLKLSADMGHKILYTTDGSIPTIDSDEYTGEIYVYDKSPEDNVFLAAQRAVMDYDDDFESEPVDKAFIIRAIAVDENGNASEPVTASYFVNKDEYRKYAVVSIVADPDELYGEDGIYVTGKDYDEWYLNGQEGEMPTANFLGKGKGYEIPASFEYFDGNSSFEQNIGLRIMGGGTRYGRVKKLNFYARREYSGKDVFDYQILDGTDSHKLSIGGSYINPIVMDLCKDRDVTTLGAVRTSFFVNGEYYCQSCLIERYDETFFEQHYGIDEKDEIILSGDEVYFDSDAQREWQKVYDFLEENDLSDDEAYKAFGEMVDIQSYIDFMCIRTYIDDSDYNEKKNFYVWKSRDDSGGFSDGRWRWALYDLDYMERNDYSKYGYECEAQKNTFEIEGEFLGGQNPYQQPLFQGLYRNESFRKQFEKTFKQIAETTFDYDRVVNFIEEYGSDLTGYSGHEELDYYLDFFRDREKYIVPYMEEFLNKEP